MHKFTTLRKLIWFFFFLFLASEQISLLWKSIRINIYFILHKAFLHHVYLSIIHKRNIVLFCILLGLFIIQRLLFEET